jgi:hypothetical protein
MAYLDDTFIWIPQNRPDPQFSRERAQTVLNNIKSEFQCDRTDGLALNVAKCTINTTADLRNNGVEILGTFIGCEENRRLFLSNKIKKTDQKLQRILQLPRQPALLLTRSCIAPTLSHLLRILEPSGLEATWSEANAVFVRAVRKLASIGAEPTLDHCARILVTLPLKFGGIGIPNYTGSVPHARRASRELCDAIAQHMELFRERPSSSDKEFLTSSRSPTEIQNYLREEVDDILNALDDSRRLAMVENASSLGSAWLRMVPLHPQWTLTDREISSALQTRLLLPVSPSSCSSCNSSDSFLHGEWCRAKPSGPRISRHNSIRDILAGRASEVGSKPTLEPTADAPGAAPGTRGDILVKGSAAPDGVSGVIDITFAATAAPLYLNRINVVKRTPGEPAVEWTKRQLGYLLAFREKEKRLKYHNAFQDPFVAMAFSTGGFPSSKSKQWLSRLQAAARRSESFFFDLSAVLVRSRAAALQ